MKNTQWRKRLFLPLFLSLFGAAVWWTVKVQGAVRLVTKEFPPYQYTDKSGKIVGRSIDQVACVMGKLKQPYTLEMVSPEEFTERVKRDEADAFFGASHTSTRDEFASLKTILENIPLYIIFKTGNTKDLHGPDAQPGGLIGTRTVSIFIEQGQKKPVQYPSYEEVMEALVRGDIDYSYADINIYKWYGFDKKYGKLITTNYAADAAYGIYWSKEFLGTRSHFVDRFNEVLKKGCPPALREEPGTDNR